MEIRLQPKVIAIAAGACAAVAGLTLVPAACIPDLPEGARGADAGLDAAFGPAVPRCGDGVVDLARGESCDPGPFGDAAVVNGCTSQCQIACDGGFVWGRNDHCYYVAPGSPGALAAAIASCEAPAHLVTFASEAELAAVTGAFDAGAFWVGMYQGVAKYVSVALLEPGWEPGCTGCFVHAPDPNAPLPAPDASVGQACVEGSSDLDASWRVIPCSPLPPKGRPAVICEREPVGRLSRPCEGGDCFGLPFTWPAKSYLLVRDSAGAPYAQSVCAAMGGSLLVLQSSDEREELWKELQHVPGLLGTGAYGLLIGLSSADGGDWTWADDAGPDAYPSPWGVRQPRGGTQAYLYESGGTTPSVDDTLARSADAPAWPYVCQIPPPDE